MAWVILSFCRRRAQDSGVPAALAALALGAWLALGVTAPAGSYGLRSYLAYHSLLNAALRPALAAAGVSPRSPGSSIPESNQLLFFSAGGEVKAYRSEADLELIRQGTVAGERTAIFSWYDWAFLVEARRPPRFFILPAPTAISVPSFLARAKQALRESGTLFVDKRCVDYLERNWPEWRDGFALVRESDNLWLFRNRARTPVP
jgi:hypothetical protein